MSFIDVLWILFIVWSLVPLYQQRRLNVNRLRLLHAIQKKRGTRLITLIHRQESLSILGITLSRFITIEDSEQVLRAIRMTPDDMPIDLLLHTPGGLVLASEQIANALRRHRGKVSVLVPHYAMSGGTLIALAADEIVMDENAVLGPVDPQLGRYPAASILNAVEKKDVNEVDDETLILADIAKKAIGQMEETVYELLREKFEEDRARELARTLTHGRWTHDYPIGCEDVRKLGLPVSCGLPTEVFALMELYPQPAGRRPSVQYVPIPDERPPRRGER